MADIEIKNKYRLPYTAIEIEKMLDKVDSISVEEIRETSNKVESLSREIQDVKNKIDLLSYETWTFTLKDGSTVTKVVHVK